MRITWITRSFLDYRIPLYQELDNLSGGQLTVIYFKDVVPERCRKKLDNVLVDRAIALSGEWRLTGKKKQPLSDVKKQSIRIPFQPGLVRAIKESKPDVMISDGFFQWTYAPLWLRMIHKIPHIMCYEGTVHTEKNAGKIKTIYRKLAKNAIDEIVCNGSLSRAYLNKLGVSNSHITDGNMIADLSANSLEEVSGLPLDKPTKKSNLGLNQYVYVYLGRLVPIKGIQEMINAWIPTMGLVKEASLLILGDGPERPIVDKIIERSSCKNIVFTGELDYSVVPDFLSLGDIFLMPTLQDNWSLVIPEAMSLGLPILCSNYNGCWPELVKKENGWVFDPLDSESFKLTLLSSWEKKDSWQEMGKVSEAIIATYTPSSVAKNIISLSKKITYNRAK
ncbi:glycosyltransferase family 4 protein [Cyclobacterium amurskyense]|uniref:glycosyltransferase family 4 protein n=1 Tax=Cyclobacterium amurskyense TaxID=320787 RepID=UPI000A03B4F8|nr:glycosyltransferase [Cyclobacterium amurskyense]